MKWNVEHRGTSTRAGTPLRRLLQESRQDKMMLWPRVGAGEMVKHGQGFRFCEKWKEELTRFPDGLGIRCERKSRMEDGSNRKEGISTNRGGEACGWGRFVGGKLKTLFGVCSLTYEIGDVY